MFARHRCSTSSCWRAILAVWLSHGLSRRGGLVLAGFLGTVKKGAESLVPNNFTGKLRAEEQKLKARMKHITEEFRNETSQTRTRIKHIDDELRKETRDLSKNLSQAVRREKEHARQELHSLTENIKQRLHDRVNRSDVAKLSGFLDTIKDDASTVKERVKHGIKSAEEQAKDKAKEWLHMEKENKLGGNSTSYNNCVLVLLVASVAVSGILGHVVDIYLFPPSFRARGHPKGWTIGIILCTYTMLFPALRSVLFSFNIFFNIEDSMGYNLTRQPITESMLFLVNLLFKTGGQTGAYLIILYAIVTPAMKVVFLVLGELWRNSDREIFRSISSVCILLVQVTSKWASPDMFAYILLLFLIRGMDHPPHMLSTAKLDVGFQCFTVFCLCSTFSTLAIHRPKLERQEQQPSASAATPLLLRCGGKQGALLIVTLLGTAFTVLLLIGIFIPCLGLHVDTNILVKPKGPVPKSMAWMLEDAIDDLKIRPWLQAEVSMWQCIAALAQWSLTGEAACILAFVLLAVFAVALSVMDMLVLAAATLTLEVPESSSAMAVSRMLKHVSMLDVFCMGVCVVCLAGQAYSAQGFCLSLRSGLFPLIGAECLHYITFYLVSGAAHEDSDNASSAIRSKQHVALKNEAEE